MFVPFKECSLFYRITPVQRRSLSLKSLSLNGGVLGSLLNARAVTDGDLPQFIPGTFLNKLLEEGIDKGNAVGVQRQTNTIVILRPKGIARKTILARILDHGTCLHGDVNDVSIYTALLKRTRAIYRALGLPTRAGANKEKVLAYMQHDKKARGDHITVIKCPGLGCWRADSLPMTELPALLGME